MNVQVQDILHWLHQFWLDLEQPLSSLALVY